MSRSGYSDGCDGWALIRWRGAVAAALRGKRGQAFLREMAAALDAMPDKRLITSYLEDENGCVCAMGAVGRERQIDMSEINETDPEEVAAAFGIAIACAKEIAYLNDEDNANCSDEARWQRMRDWVSEQIRETKP